MNFAQHSTTVFFSISVLKSDDQTLSEKLKKTENWKCENLKINKYLSEGPAEAHLSTAVAWREKKCKHFVFNKYFSLVLGVLKSKKS